VPRDTGRYLSVYRNIPREARGKDEDQRLYLKSEGVNKKSERESELKSELLAEEESSDYVYRRLI
jgi:hypothetical protein